MEIFLGLSAILMNYEIKFLVDLFKQNRMSSVCIPKAIKQTERIEK